jgi:regulator of sigma E protease
VIGGAFGHMLSALLPILHTAWTIFLALMILNVMILVHEWGHFLAARWRGLKVEKFQIWFGQPIWKRTWNGVQYGLGWIPAGGFVALPQMAPMEAIEGSGDHPREPLPAISPLDKIIVAFAGPLFSILLALFFAVIVWKVGRPINEPENPTQIGYIDPDKPAGASDLKVGDTIRAIDGNPVHRWNGQVHSVVWGIVSSANEQIIFTVDRDGQRLDIPVTPKLEPLDGEASQAGGPLRRAVDFVFKRPPLRKVGLASRSATLRVEEILPHSPVAEAGMQRGDVLAALNGQPLAHFFTLLDHIKKHGTEPFTLTVTRDGRPVDLTVTPRLPDKPKDVKEPQLGIVSFDDPALRTTHLHQRPFEQIGESLLAMKNLVRGIASKSEISVAHMGGPVTIVRTYMAILQNPEAWRWVLWFSVFLNVNLAVMNMLPFPVLDGGHITMAIIEWIRRRPLSVRVLEYVQSACVLLVLGFFIMVTLKDVGDVAGSRGESIEFLPRSQP